VSDGPPRASGDPEPKRDDVARAAVACAVLGVLFSLTALGMYGPRTACSVLVGAAMAVGNLLAMRLILRAVVQAPPEDGAPDEGEARSAGRSLFWGLLAVLKILVFFGGVWLLLTRQLVDPMPLVVGYGVLPLGIAASAIGSSLRGSRP
jgi:sterol desaturase/sphingolipid hydroxylase (fatty acid hydroxylase superfamily)